MIEFDRELTTAEVEAVVEQLEIVAAGARAVLALAEKGDAVNLDVAHFFIALYTRDLVKLETLLRPLGTSAPFTLLEALAPTSTHPNRNLN